MKPTELLERLRVLSNAGSGIDTVMIAPLNPAMATHLVSELATDFPECMRQHEGQITAQDLRELLDLIDLFREKLPA